MFLSYKAEVKNQLNRKIKRLRSDWGGEYTLFDDFAVSWDPLIAYMIVNQIR